MIKYQTLRSVVSDLKVTKISSTMEDMRSDRKLLIGLLEQSAEGLRILEDEVRSLRDEVNRLKGEPANPKFKPKKSNVDISSEEERKGTADCEVSKKSKEKKSKIKYFGVNYAPLTSLNYHLMRYLRDMKQLLSPLADDYQLFC